VGALLVLVAIQIYCYLLKTISVVVCHGLLIMAGTPNKLAYAHIVRVQYARRSTVEKGSL
jgi:hypothetical protein